MTVGPPLRLLGAVACLLLAACSDDAGAPEPSSSSTTTSSSPTTVVFAGNADSAFCRLLGEAADRPVLDPFEAGLDAGEVELRFRALQLRFGEFADVAPPELEADLDVLVAALDDLGDELDAVDYDFAALAESGADVGGVDDPEFADASDRIAAYGEQVCS